jgi:hypothetical protein
METLKIGLQFIMIWLGTYDYFVMLDYFNHSFGEVMLLAIGRLSTFIF